MNKLIQLVYGSNIHKHIHYCIVIYYYFVIDLNKKDRKKKQISKRKILFLFRKIQTVFLPPREFSYVRRYFNTPLQFFYNQLQHFISGIFVTYSSGISTPIYKISPGSNIIQYIQIYIYVYISSQKNEIKNANI